MDGSDAAVARRQRPSSMPPEDRLDRRDALLLRLEVARRGARRRSGPVRVRRQDRSQA